jgi:drug/metabolite transporter (DMT)-like permease
VRLRSDLRSDGALLLTALIWGSTFVMAKDLLERWPPVAYITVRFAIATLVLATRGRSRRRALRTGARA